MKTTVTLNDTLLAEALKLAAEQRISISRLIEEGLRLRLQLQHGRPGSHQLPVYQGTGGLVPGLDGRSHKALLDAADNA